MFLKSNDGTELKPLLNLFVLLYADDTILMSESRQGLQNALDALFDYCKYWKLEVNREKTKVMIFHKRKKSETLRFDSTVLEVVDSFRYLGVEFSRTGSFAKGKKYAFDKAQKALFSLLQSARRKNFPIDVLLDLYQKMVIPVLLYGCEIWGHEKLDIIEKLHIKSLKYILHLNRSTMSSQVYGESGIFPILLDVKVRMIRFWADLVKPSSPKLASKVYNIFHDLYSAGEFMSPWITQIKQTLIESGLECVWETRRFTNKNSLCSIIRKELKTKMATEWKVTLDNSSKCLFYKNYKPRLVLEPFFQNLPERFAIALVKFRCNNHKLPIEQGRKFGIPREDRVCRKCNMNVVGDEFHLIMECPAYLVERLQYVPRRFRLIKSTYNFCKLMGDKSKQVNLKLAKFLIATGAV